jgi:hypothetical protein
MKSRFPTRRVVLAAALGGSATSAVGGTCLIGSIAGPSANVGA